MPPGSPAPGRDAAAPFYGLLEDTSCLAFLFSCVGEACEFEFECKAKKPAAREGDQRVLLLLSPLCRCALCSGACSMSACQTGVYGHGYSKPAEHAEHRLLPLRLV